MRTDSTAWIWRRLDRGWALTCGACGQGFETRWLLIACFRIACHTHPPQKGSPA